MADQMTPDELRAAANFVIADWGEETEVGEPEIACAKAALRLADVIEYAERIAGSNRAESPFAVERVRHHDALSILRIDRVEDLDPRECPHAEKGKP